MTDIDGFDIDVPEEIEDALITGHLTDEWGSLTDLTRNYLEEHLS